MSDSASQLSQNRRDRLRYEFHRVKQGLEGARKCVYWLANICISRLTYHYSVRRLVPR